MQPAMSGEQLELTSPAADFIQNRLSSYHTAFDTRHVRYDQMLRQFVAMEPPLSPPLPPLAGQENLRLAVPQASAPSPRPPPVTTNEMQFWSDVFPKAMSRLQLEPEPPKLAQSNWSIRSLVFWRDVQAKLDMAQRKYDHHFGKQVGRFRRKLRDILDKCVVPLQQGVKLVPNVDLASPVVGVVNILLDVRS